MTDRIRDALQYLNHDDREVWIMAGMAVKHELGEDGFDVWDTWSQRSEAYEAKAARASWRSFRGSGITIGSLFHEAQAAGWKPSDDDTYIPPTEAQLQAQQQARNTRLAAERKQRAQDAANAARKATWILQQCKHEKHAYLHSKGWPDMFGSVWWPAEDQNLLCIPMRVGADLVGVQLIDRRGEKKYLKGQRTSGAEHCISNPGPGARDWWCEGYATGISLRDCLNALRMRYRIHVCFSAGNLKKMARAGLVVADNDEKKTGETAAQATGLPYFLPPPGDLNDMHKAQGVFRTSQALRKWLATVQAQEAGM
jgi:putative DNA primase/helicase